MWWLIWFACSETCPLPEAVLGERSFDVILSPVDYAITNEAAFPAEVAPGNGGHELLFDWAAGDLADAPIVVSLDGQPFEGEGTWDELNCGHFLASWRGEYVSALGSEHAIAVSADLVTFDGTIDGFLTWRETWSTADQVGTFEAATQLTTARTP